MSEYTELLERLDGYNRDIFTKSATAIRNVIAENAALRAELAAIKAQEPRNGRLPAHIESMIAKLKDIAGCDVCQAHKWVAEDWAEEHFGSPAEAKFVAMASPANILTLINIIESPALVASTTQDADKSLLSEYEQCTHPTCGRYQMGTQWQCRALGDNACDRPRSIAYAALAQKGSTE